MQKNKKKTKYSDNQFPLSRKSWRIVMAKKQTLNAVVRHSSGCDSGPKWAGIEEFHSKIRHAPLKNTWSCLYKIILFQTIVNNTKPLAAKVKTSYLMSFSCFFFLLLYTDDKLVLWNKSPEMASNCTAPLNLSEQQIFSYVNKLRPILLLTDNTCIVRTVSLKLIDLKATNSLIRLISQ